MAMPITRRWISSLCWALWRPRALSASWWRRLPGCQPEEILGSDLFLYNREKAKIWGAEGEYLSARALDDLQCAWATMEGFLQAKEGKSIPVCCIFDNEEVGSNTQQGADSTLLLDTLSRICAGLGMDYQGRLWPTALWSLRTMPMPCIPIIRSMPIRTTGL